MLTKCLAAEWAAHHIRVNGIAPGFIRTEMTGDVVRLQPEVAQEFWENGAVMNRMGNVDELSAAAIYLASDAASFTTGEIMTVDGGFTLR